MCIGSSTTPWTRLRRHLSASRSPKRTRLHVLRLSRRRKQWEGKEVTGSDIQLRNLKLYMENISILEENEKLRRRASLLHQENLALVSEFQKKFSGISDKLSTNSKFSLIHTELMMMK